MSFRRKRHRRRFRVLNRRRFIAAQVVLAVIALGALGLSAQVVVRSIRTARLNRSLAALHTVSGEAPEAQVAAPPMAVTEPPAARRSAGTLKLARMGLPDGSAIEMESAETGLRHTLGGDILPDMQKLVRQNPDTVGWLYIKGIVSLPVVYRDNQYYLNHDFSGHHNSSGALFLDASHPLLTDAQNLLIHGHAMYDGSMFGLLTHYKAADAVREHPLIDFSTLYEKETYVVFAVLKVASKPGDPNYFDYFSHPTFSDAADFTEYIARVQARSLFDIPVSVASTDALLTLSTCLDDDRLVVFARKLRPEETRDELISAAQATL